LTLLLLLALATTPNGEGLDSARYNRVSSWEAPLSAQAGALAQQPIGALPARNSAKISRAGILPDPALTPGHVATTDRATVCERGYSRRVRKVSTATKRAVMRAYGIDPDRRPDLEVDHLIALSLGGDNSIENLWPQLARPLPGYHQKDRLEHRAWLDVCAGRLDLKYAQRRMAEDWVSFYAEVFGRPATGAAR